MLRDLLEEAQEEQEEEKSGNSLEGNGGEDLATGYRPEMEDEGEYDEASA